MLSFIKKKIATFAKSRIQLYRDDRFYTGNGVQIEAKEFTRFTFLFISNQYAVELHQFFNIKKKSDLLEAVDIFAVQNSPFRNSEYWVKTYDNNDGYFVTLTFIEKELCEKLGSYMKGGGVLLPESSLAEFFVCPRETVALDSGQYTWDTNYRGVYESNVSAFENLLSTSNSRLRLTNEQLFEKICEYFNAKSLIGYYKKVKFSQTGQGKLTVKSVLLFSLVVMSYFTLSSSYLYFSNQKLESAFHANKEMLAQLQVKKQKLESLKQKLEMLNQPFKGINSKALMLASLPKIESSYELTGIVVNDDEVSIRGEAINATKLFEALSNSKNIHSVHYKTPVREVGSADIFSIGFRIKEQNVVE